MPKKLTKTKGRDIIRASRVIKTADITGVSHRQVRRVIRGDQLNERVLSVYMRIQEEENKLIESIKIAVPFN